MDLISGIYQGSIFDFTGTYWRFPGRGKEGLVIALNRDMGKTD
jgi:hypothetical protein